MKKAYPTYKETEIPWGKQIPEEWKTVRYKYLFSEINERSETGTEDLLSVSQYTGVTLRREKMSDDRDNLTNAASLEGYKKVAKDDLVTNIMLAWNGSLGISPYDGIASPAYSIYRGNERVYPQYFHYLVRTNFSKDDFKKVSTGVIESRLRMYTDDFFALYTIVPPLPEQRQIAAYLDHKCALIDTFIAKKNRLIELLQEQKQAIINQAVTHGINSDVELKPSGVDWLGDIPAHWEVKKLKYVAGFKSGTNLTSEVIQEEGEYAVYGGNGIRGYYPEFTHEGEFILIGRQGALCGNINYARGKFWPTEHAVVVYPKGQVDLIWFGELLRAMNLNQYSQSAAQPGLSVENIKNLFIPFPEHETQVEIGDYLSSEFKTIAETIQRIKAEITLIQEYKTTLIAEAVTGKIDVRDWKPEKETDIPEGLKTAFS